MMEIEGIPLPNAAAPASAHMILSRGGEVIDGAGTGGDPNHPYASGTGGGEAIRFEDLTVDDDMPLIDRIVRYCHSPVALQRLVHVKMLAEASELSGGHVCRTVLVPAMRSLVQDPESVIRQHVAAQLLAVSIVCMLELSQTATKTAANRDAASAATVFSVQQLVDDPGSSIEWGWWGLNHTARKPHHPKPPPQQQQHPHHFCYNEEGYETVVSIVVAEYLNALLSDVDLDVRRAAANSISGLAWHLRPDDVPSVCLPVPLRFVYQTASDSTATVSTTTTITTNNNNNNNNYASNSSSSSSGNNFQHPQPHPPQRKKKSEADQRLEELRITSANLLAELGGSASEHRHLLLRLQQQQQQQHSHHSYSHREADWVGTQILPAILELCADSSFRVRRSGVQALPRILAACSIDLVVEKILPVFEKLSTDPVHRIRKSVGECLVDMSRALMILSECHNYYTSSTTTTSTTSGGKGLGKGGSDRGKLLLKIRRTKLIPIADRLIQDGHKMVRQGMMQFLGPFIASFYPYQFSALDSLLPSKTESDGSNHMGIAAQFFPHASSMVSRLNSSQNSITTAPAPIHNIENMVLQVKDFSKLKYALPHFLQAQRMATLSLAAVVAHRKLHSPDPQDLEAIRDQLLDYFAALATVTTGDDNTDAEMRVYCAYSFPAIALLLGPENWDGPMKTCFFSLLNSNYYSQSNNSNLELIHDGVVESQAAAPPPLPVKRCLASSLHTVASVLSSTIASQEVIPVFRHFFLHDNDDSVRLNVIRNFPALLKLLPTPAERASLFLEWSAMVQGDSLLGATIGHSATNPQVLNWRQRDYVARSLPELMGLVEVVHVKEHLWPIMQRLLVDPVSTVREDAMWALPLLFRAYCCSPPSSKAGFVVDSTNAADFSPQRECTAVVRWLQEIILCHCLGDDLASSIPNNTLQPTTKKMINSNMTDRKVKRSTSYLQRPKTANFGDRQMYCRMCGTVGVALRFSEGYEAEGNNENNDVDDYDFGDADNNKDPVSVLTLKFKSMFPSSSTKGFSIDISSGPYHRLTQAEQQHLTRILMDEMLDPALAMKEDRTSNVRVSLMKVLLLMPNNIQHSTKCKHVLKNLIEEVETWESFGTTSPEISNIKSAPTSSSPVVTTSSKSSNKVKSAKSIMRGLAETQTMPATGTEGGLGPGPIDVDEVSVTPQSSQDEDDFAGQIHWATVVFEDGPIGMQLEPTAQDRGCRVFDFLDTGPDHPSPARLSGQISVGDVIVSVNGTVIESYDATIDILKAGGRREIVFRPGNNDDACEGGYYSKEDGKEDAGSSDEEADEKEHRKREKKPRKDKKSSSSKKEKKVKK